MIHNNYNQLLSIFTGRVPQHFARLYFSVWYVREVFLFGPKATLQAFKLYVFALEKQSVVKTVNEVGQITVLGEKIVPKSPKDFHPQFFLG